MSVAATTSLNQTVTLRSPFAAAPTATEASRSIPDQVTIRGTGAAEAHEPATSHTWVQKAGLASMAAFSLLGALGCATTAAYAEQPRPVSISTTTNRSQSDVQILQQLERKGQIFKSDDDRDSDALGSRLDTFGAKQILDQGGSIIVTSPRKGRYENFTSFYPPTQGDIAAHFRPSGVRVSSYQDLERLNAAEHLSNVNTSGSLAPEERTMLGQLQDYEGGVTQPQVLQQSYYIPPVYAWDRWGNYIIISPGYYGTQYYASSPDAQPRLEDHDKVGTVLGLGGHHHRMTTYEAMDALEGGKGVDVRTTSGIKHTIHTPAELADLHDVQH